MIQLNKRNSEAIGMTIRDFYVSINGSYDDFLSRVGTEERAKKYIKMFTMDPTYNELNSAIAAQDFVSAFRAIHTLKGLAGNLAFNDFYQSCCALTEILRTYNGEDYSTALEEVNCKYQAIINAVGQLD